MTRGHLVFLPPNRVWRSYTGGATLDRIAGSPAPRDSHLAEDWIGSVTETRQPGREGHAEGISCVEVAGQRCNFRDLLASDPDYFLGAAHVARYGASPMLLVKFLDSAIRLHFQVHPTREFAQQRLGSPSGKTEAYHILATRPDVTEPYIYAGFQRPPTRRQLREWILRQDIAAIERCFDRIPVRPGDTFLIPGGCPHALGEGVFMVEIQEPTDWVVRLEFERGGYVLPEAARFMGRDVDFGLDLVDFSPRPLAEVPRSLGCAARRLRDFDADGWQDELIGPAQTPCFRVLRTELRAPLRRTESGFHLGIVTAGAVTVSAGGESRLLQTYDKYFLPAGLGSVEFCPQPEATILECHPPA